MTTNQLFKQNNRDLMLRLLESKAPIECDSFSDLNEDVINYSLKEHGYE